MDNTGLIDRALTAAGYDEMERTEAGLIECFLDFVDGGVWRNLDSVEEAAQEIADGEITVGDMCRALIKSAR